MKTSIQPSLKKLNPKHSLFGKLFLWFWLATIVLIISSVWLSRQFNADEQIRPITEHQQKALNKVKDRVESLNTRKRKPRDLKKLAFHLNRQFNFGIVIYDVEREVLRVTRSGAQSYSERAQIFSKILQSGVGFRGAFSIVPGATASQQTLSVTN